MIQAPLRYDLRCAQRHAALTYKAIKGTLSQKRMLK